MKMKWKASLCTLCCALLLGGCSIAEDALQQVAGELTAAHEDDRETEEQKKTEETEKTEKTEKTAEKGTEAAGTERKDGFLRPRLQGYSDNGSYSNWYYSERLFDGDEDTSWIGQMGKAREAYFMIFFEEPFTITDLSMVNGGWENGEEWFYKSARVKNFTLTYDDDTKDNFSVKSGDDRYWSTSIVPRTTSYVLLEVTDIYEGADEEQPLAIGELDFFCNPASVKDETKAETKSETRPETKSETRSAVPDYMPSWYTWAPTGYDTQDMDLNWLQAGKWISEDGNTVLYTDYKSSPDGMDFGIYYEGKIYDNQLYGTVDWNQLNEDGEPYMADDPEYGFEFSVPQKGVMDVKKDGKTVRLYLKRAKYQ